jgi:lipopolysaccharide cholinephosphotransferase
VKVIDTRTVKIEPHLRYKEQLGVDLDIFPIDGQPDDTATFEAWYAELMKIYKKYVLKTVTPTYPKLKTNLNLIRKQIFIPSCQTLLKKAEKLHAQYPYETSAFVGTVESAFNGIGNRVEKTAYEDYTLVEFEGYTFRAPKDYDKVLRNLYGEYMQLPPVEKQVTHHENKVYWKE